MIHVNYEQQEEIGLKYVRDQLNPASPYGVKYLKQEGFYGPDQRPELEAELDNVARLKEAAGSQSGLVADIQHALSGFKDLSGTFRKGAQQPLTEVELFELLAFCRRLEALLPLLGKLEVYSRLSGAALTSVAPVLAVLDPWESGRISFYVEDDRSFALAAARREKRQAEGRLREAAGAEKEALLLRRQEAARQEEDALQAIYQEMTEQIRPHLPLLTANAAALGRLDGCMAKALLAHRLGLVRPRVGRDRLVLTEAVHPEVAWALSQRGRDFTALSMTLPQGVSLLTGANMGGKSIALKTVLLTVALALGGCFVPAQEAEIPLFSRIEIINRDFSDASQGLSSFGGEILRLKEALERLQEGGLSLIVMDELARGTNAREGAAIVQGTVRYLSDKNAVTLLATHYDGAGQEAARHYQVKGLVKMETPIENAMDYGLIEVAPGTDCPQDALAICRLLGLPEEILEEKA